MVMAASHKRSYSTIQAREDLDKRKKLCSSYSERESSIESFSSCSIQDHSELSCDSEFEEHDYCMQKQIKYKIPKKHTTSDNIDFKWKVNRMGPEFKNRKPKCNSKNAVIARNNRLKKKKYIENLETRNAKLEAENKSLQDSVNRKVEEINSLIRETINLRCVIRNRTEIGSLLKCIHHNTNLQISSSILNDMSKCSQKNQNDYRSHNSVTPTFTSSTDENHTLIKGCKNHEISQSSVISSFMSSNNEEPASTEEGKSDINELIFSHKSQIPVSNGIFDESNIDLMLDTPSSNEACYEFQTDIISHDVSEFLTQSKSTSEQIESDILLRCETPSKGFHELWNKETLFDDMGLGLCLHIANKKVSLEFCDSCNLKASQ